MAWTNVHPEVPYISQPTASICWLACLQMMFKWKGDTRDPYKVLMDSPDIFPEPWLQIGVGPENCRPIAKCLGLGFAGDGDADINALAAALKSHGPYWVAGAWIKNSAHVKVIIGCDPAANQIKMLNPWNPIDNVDFASIEKFNDRGAQWKVEGSFMYWS